MGKNLWMLSRETLLAACRVIGTHVHIGMPNHEMALRVYNNVISCVPILCHLGDHSNGERLQIYKVMAPNCVPVRYEDWDEFSTYARKNGFANDPRKCWHLIRISIHGTIEFRMFGVTRKLTEIVTWAKVCHRLCTQAAQK